MRIALDLTGTCTKQPDGCAYAIMDTVDALLTENASRKNPHQFTFFRRLSRWKKRAYGFRPAGARVHWFQEPWLPRRTPFDVVQGFGSRVPNWAAPAKVGYLNDVMAVNDVIKHVHSLDSRTRKAKHYKALVANSDLVFVPSEATKNDLLKYFHYPRARIKVVYMPVDSKFSPSAEGNWPNVKEHYDLPDQYLLFVGAINARKNVGRLIEAYALSSVKNHYQLVLAGSAGEETETVLEICRKSGVQHQVHITGYVADEDLPTIYACAAGLVFPTLYEGFGRPILEAMASGIPVLVGNQGAAPEVAAGYGVAVDPTDVDAIAQGIEDLLAVSPQQRQSALAYAKGFTKDSTAKTIFDAYDWVVDNRRGRVREAS